MKDIGLLKPGADGITAACFEGGGMKVMGVAGAIACLDKLGIRRQLRRFIGTSAGSLAALFCALDIPGNELEDLMAVMDTAALCPGGAWAVVTTMLHGRGMYDGARLSKLVDDPLQRYAGNKHVTMLELHAKTGYDLVFTTTCADDDTTVYVSHSTHPEMEVRDAVRASMSIPVLFTPFAYQGNTFVDGGVRDNIPSNYFSPAHDTLVVSIVGDRDHQRVRLKTLTEYVQRVVELVMSNVGLSDLGPGVRWVLKIDSEDVKIAAFDLPSKRRRDLMAKAFDTTRAYFLQQNEHVSEISELSQPPEPELLPKPLPLPPPPATELLPAPPLSPCSTFAPAPVSWGPWGSFWAWFGY